MRGSKPLGLIAFWWKSVPEFLRKLIATCDFPVGEGSSQIMHTRGRLLGQAMILFNNVPFQNRNFFSSEFFLRKKLLPEDASSFL